MKLDRLSYDPGAVLDFYEEGLAGLGALCERTWHDRLEVVAEGRAAALWNAEGGLYSGELHFAPADATAARDASREIFSGCPLTFQLAEALRPEPLAVERVVISRDAASRPPDAATAERLWRGQFPDTTRWRLAKPFQAAFHFSLVVLVRCEIQAIDQHWSLHRLALSLPNGETDDSLAREIAFAQVDAGGGSGLSWPAADPSHWRSLVEKALEGGLGNELAGIRARQENSLQRELERIDTYFENYAAELTARGSHTASESVKTKVSDRLAAARSEHARRRADQAARHEIRVLPRLDALLLIAEHAWRAQAEVQRSRLSQTIEAAYVPRARRWFTSSV